MEAYSVGIDGTAIFNATGTQGPPGIIVIDSGNNQISAVNQPLPKPLIAVVVDSGSNRLPNVPVTFTVKQGGGSFNGQTTLSTTSDSDGRVAATLTLGLQEGNSNNLIEANFATNQGFPASFTASGRAQGDPAKTTISGVVLDNSNVPIPAVTIRAALTNVMNSNSNAVQTAATAQTDAKGQFTIAQAPVGFVKLLVDGSTAGPYPTLDYDMVTVAGQTNTVGQPIFLLPIKTNNKLCVQGDTGGGTLTIPQAPGFSLTFGPRQVTFPGGSKDGCISVTVVHPDKVPMTPGFGQQPRFIVTIQPSGALFNPPAPITLPNVDGLAPRGVTEMYSFDHDIGSFVAIGTGVVSDDGQVIRSSQGVGVLKAGWHCGGNPNARGTVANCGPCEYCQGPNGNQLSCIPDPGQVGQSCGTSGNACVTSQCGFDPTNQRPTGACIVTPLPVTTRCVSGGNQLGNCVGGVCQGSGGQCPNCPTGNCVNGQCVSQNCFGLPNNTTCAAGGTTAGTCQNGQCLGSGNQCAASCNGGSCVNGVCAQPNCNGQTGGTLCISGGSVPGICINGQCKGSGNQCPATCNGGTCINGQCQSNQCTPTGVGTPCDDGKYCTSADGISPGPDSCASGACLGTPVADKTIIPTVSPSFDFKHISDAFFTSLLGHSKITVFGVV